MTCWVTHVVYQEPVVEPDDRELVRQVLQGRTEDFRMLVDRYHRPIFRFACGILGHRETAKDATQDTFLAAFANLSRYAPSRGAFSTWLYTIARNRCLNLMKRRPMPTLTEPDAVVGARPADPMMNEEVARRLDEALARLPVAQRTAFVLAEIEALPHAEIARIEQTSLGTVKSRVHRARKRLRALLEPYVGEPA